MTENIETGAMVAPVDIKAQTVQPEFTLGKKVKTWTVFKNDVQHSVNLSLVAAKDRYPDAEWFEGKRTDKSIVALTSPDDLVEPGSDHFVIREIDVGFEQRNQDEHAEAMVTHLLGVIANAPPHPANRYYVEHKYPVPFTCNDGTIEMRDVEPPSSVTNRVNARFREMGYKVIKPKLEKSGRELSGWYVTLPTKSLQ